MPNKSGRPIPAFTLLAKPAGADCNLACEYCFYLDKQQLYPNRHLRMPDKVLEAFIKQMLAAHPAGEVNISWQGGEPTLMGLEFFIRSVELAGMYRRPGQQVAYSLQTNGLLLDEAWCKFFKQHNFLIGLSLDGPRQMHNAFRVNKGGRGSYDQVRRGWEVLQAQRVDTNILCAVHVANADHPLEIYRFLRDELQAEFIQFIPVVERNSASAFRHVDERAGELARVQPAQNTQIEASVSSRSVGPGQYGTFLSAIFDEWVHRDVGKIFVQAFDSALASWCRLPASVCSFQEVCGASLILEHNGDLYSCDHFVDRAHRLGNILERPLVELVQSAKQRQFGLSKRNQLPGSCRQCEFLFACHGECPRNRFVQSADGAEVGLNYLCASYKWFFSHIDKPMRKMVDLLAHGRSPAEVMHMLSN